MNQAILNRARRSPTSQVIGGCSAVASGIRRLVGHGGRARLVEVFRNEPQIFDKTAVVLLSLSRIRPSENGGWMGCDEYGFSQWRGQGASAEFIHAYAFAEHRLGGCDAQAEDGARLQHLNFCFQPGSAGRDFGGGGFLVLAAFALRLPFKMFDGVGDIDVAAGDAGFLQRLVQHSAGRSDKGVAGHIFLIARLFTDEQQCGASRPFPEDRLRGGFIEVAARAGGGGVPQRREGQFGREKGGG